MPCPVTQISRSVRLILPQTALGDDYTVSCTIIE